MRRNPKIDSTLYVKVGLRELREPFLQTGPGLHFNLRSDTVPHCDIDSHESSEVIGEPDYRKRIRNFSSTARIVQSREWA